jgi:hypothetical protein
MNTQQESFERIRLMKTSLMIYLNDQIGNEVVFNLLGMIVENREAQLKNNPQLQFRTMT